MSINVAVIGFGYWGPNIVRNFVTRGCKVSYIADLSESRRKAAAESCPDANIVVDYEDALNDPSVDAVAIILPAKFHYVVAKAALEHDKHVLIEKPVTLKSEDALELRDIAVSRQLVILVDHTYLYSNAIAQIKDIIKGERIKYIHSTRSNLGVFRTDVNVVWDLAPHDLSIIQELTGEFPRRVQSFATTHNKNRVLDSAHILVEYDTFQAELVMSWITPIKIRTMIIATDSKMVEFNDLEGTYKVTVHDSGFSEQNGAVSCWNNGLNRLYSDPQEPLSMMIDDFIRCITGHKEPKSGISEGIDVIKILEAVDASLVDSDKGVCVDE